MRSKIVSGAGRAAIRIGRDADRGFVVSLSEEAFRRYSVRPQALADRLLVEGSTLIAEHALAGRAVPLGFASVEIYAKKLAHLSAIAVRPEARGCGLGRELVDAAEEYARARGAVAMSLLTAEDNVDAQRLFERAGYQRLLDVADAYRGGIGGVRMLKSLTLR